MTPCLRKLHLWVWALVLIPWAGYASAGDQPGMVCLQVGGLVQRELRLSARDLKSLPAISTKHGQGVSLGEIISRAGLRQGAARVVLMGGDGYTASFFLEPGFFGENKVVLLLPGPGGCASGLRLAPESLERLGYKWVAFPIRRVEITGEGY